jgi:hypothetical protein
MVKMGEIEVVDSGCPLREVCPFGRFAHYGWDGRL